MCTAAVLLNVPLRVCAGKFQNSVIRMYGFLFASACVRFLSPLLYTYKCIYIRSNLARPRRCKDQGKASASAGGHPNKLCALALVSHKHQASCQICCVVRMHSGTLLPSLHQTALALEPFWLPALFITGNYSKHTPFFHVRTVAIRNHWCNATCVCCWNQTDGEICAKTGGRSRALRHGAGDAQDGSHRGVRRRRSGVARVGMPLTGLGGRGGRKSLNFTVYLLF